MMLTNQLKMLVRADVGSSVGTGHVMRMLALGQAWRRMGGEVTFVSGEMPSGLVKRIESENFQLLQIQNDQCDGADAKDTVEIASGVQPNWIALDGYQFDDDYQHAIREYGAQLMVIDDFNHASHKHADLVVNQNSYANQNQYSRLSQTPILTGEKYVLLRDEFASVRDALPDARHAVNEVRRILVTFGGADTDNWTLKTLQALSDLNRKRLVVDCVIGACYRHVAELEMFKKTSALNLRIHRNVDRMSALMTRVDLAITAGGSTCYELARCGVPSIVTAIAENQKPVALAMHRNQVMISIDDEQPDPATVPQEPVPKESRLIKAIRQLIQDPDRRRDMAQRGMQLVDSLGAFRIVQKMSALLYPFRAATLADSPKMWRWRNDPEVRSVSFTKEIIPFEEHQAWLRRRLDDPQAIIWVSEDLNGSAVGQVRFEFIENGQTALISIIVDQARRGRGLGTVLIVAACQEFLESNAACRIIAQVKPTNAASEKAFRAAGFRSIEPTIVGGKMALQFVFERESTAAPLRTRLQKSA